MTDPELEERIARGREMIHKLLAAPKVPFGTLTPAKLPEVQGLYLIADVTTGEALRAGLTKVTLRQRVYQNHLMGDQSGNLRAQLCKAQVCPDLEMSKDWVRQRCSVQFLTVDELGFDLNWAEHFMLSVVRPRFTDGRG